MNIEILDNRLLLAANPNSDYQGLDTCEMDACNLNSEDISTLFDHKGLCYDKLLKHYNIDAQQENAQCLLNDKINNEIKTAMVESGVKNGINDETIRRMLKFPKEEIQELKTDDLGWVSDTAWQTGKFLGLLFTTTAISEYVRACQPLWESLRESVGSSFGLGWHSNWISNVAVSGSAALSGTATANVVKAGLGYLEQTPTSDMEDIILSCIHVEYRQNIKIIQCASILRACSDLNSYPAVSVITQLSLDDVTDICNEYSKCSGPKTYLDGQQPQAREEL